MDKDHENTALSLFPLAIYGEGVPAKRAGERSDNVVNNPSRINIQRLLSVYLIVPQRSP